MTSEIGRMFKCLKSKPSYHSLQDDAYSHITLIPTEEATELSPTNNEISVTGKIAENELMVSPFLKAKCLVEESRENSPSIDSNPSVINDGSINDGLSNQEVSQRESISIAVNNNNQLNSSCITINPSETSDIKTPPPTASQSTGGLLSFFGLKFNKSSTRHLDRPSKSDTTVEKTNESPSSACNANRYTKFPLKANANGNSTSVEIDKSSVSSELFPSSSRSEGESCASLVTEISAAPQSNSKFDPSEIQSTPQTKVYSNPNRSPSRTSRKSTTFSPSNFLTSAISSFGKKSHHNQKSSSKFRLRVKSKSDNNLHRVDLNSVASGSSVLTSVLRGTRGTSSSQNIYNCEPGGSELRLNSVQIGDHATIHLPWTGGVTLGQQNSHRLNNLSGATSSSTRVHQNTHSNNFDSGTVRYVECGFQWSKDDHHSSSSSSSNGNNALRQNSIFSQQSKNKKSKVAVAAQLQSNSRRRSKSLEREFNFRINKTSLASSSASTLNSSSQSSTDSLRSHSNKTLVSPRVQSNKFQDNLNATSKHRSLTPEEQEALLRNITWDNNSTSESVAAEVPPPRPAKPDLNKRPLCRIACTSNHTSPAKSLPTKPGLNRYKPPPIGAIPRSAPNSFSNSSESDSIPPSPPPRPPSSLKPESRLIIQNTKKSQLHNSGGGIVRSNSFATTPTKTKNSVGDSDTSSDTLEVSSDSGVTSGYRFPALQKYRRQLSPVEQTHFQFPSQSLSSSSSLDHFNTTAIIPQIGPKTKTMSVEESCNSGFINKPSKGWLHSDQLLSREGVTYTVRYIGCLDVNTSMKSLDFDTRSLIAKECINQVCEAAGLKIAERKRKMDRNLSRILGLRPRMDHSGSDVHLTITSTCLKLTSLETGAVIAAHEMPNISFASSGDASKLDFIAYVAKDNVVGRACYILECGRGLAQDVIITVGQAFELRLKVYIQNRPPPPRIPNDDREYYNDLPGKLPPDISNTTNALKDGKPNNSDVKQNATGGKLREIPSLTLPISTEVGSVNLIDFEAPTPPAFGPTTQEKHLESLLLGPSDLPSSSNQGATVSASATSTGTGLGLPNSPSQPQPPSINKDPFDMENFSGDLPKLLSNFEQRKQLESQTWFHGSISRSKAEELVKENGDFLVRESQTNPGQFVLTGMDENGSLKHFTLVDPAGIVRTKDQTFESVVHLINHHFDNHLPIMWTESIVILRHPVKH